MIVCYFKDFHGTHEDYYGSDGYFAHCVWICQLNSKRITAQYQISQNDMARLTDRFIRLSLVYSMYHHMKICVR